MSKDLVEGGLRYYYQGVDWIVTDINKIGRSDVPQTLVLHRQWQTAKLNPIPLTVPGICVRHVRGVV